MLLQLYDELKAKESYRRYEAVIALGECRKFLKTEPTKEMLEQLIPLLNDDDTHVRYYAAVAIGNLGFKEAIPYIEQRIIIEKEIQTFSSYLRPYDALSNALEKLK